MTPRTPATRAEAKQAQATRSPSVRSGGSGRLRQRPLRREAGPLPRQEVAACAPCGPCSRSASSGWSPSGIAYARTDIPDANELATAQASIVYYSDGKTEMARLSDAEGNRESVPLSRVPDHMQKAMLAAEDQDFYQNNGISPTGIARAVWVAVKGGQATQGGSTITQQYVKNYFLTADRTLSRKAREILISLKIDQQQSKDQILENYLNTIYYGRGAYGIQTASKAYFNKDVSKLTPAESAFLASVIRGPVALRPGPGREAGRERQGALGLHPRRDGREGLAQPGRARRRHLPGVQDVQARAPRAGPTGYLTQMVKNEVVTKYKIPQSDLDRGGCASSRRSTRASRPTWSRRSRTSARRRRRRCTSAWPRSARATAPSSPSTAARTTRSASRTPRPRTRCRPARRSRSSP